MSKNIFITLGLNFEDHSVVIAGVSRRWVEAVRKADDRKNDPEAPYTLAHAFRLHSTTGNDIDAWLMSNGVAANERERIVRRIGRELMSMMEPAT